MKELSDFNATARLIISGLNRKMYTENEVAFYLLEAYNKGLNDSDEGGRQHHATYSYKGVF